MMNAHQFGLMEGRYIRDNIRGPLSVINLAEDEISLVFYYPLTLKKLLMPSVGNSYIKYLAFFNFGDTFQQWIAILFFNNIFSCVLHTGWATPFSIKVITKLPNSEQSYKGKVQTHNYINRQNQSTTGKWSKELKLFQYGSDGQIALDGSANLIRNVVKLLDSDTAIGGLKLNYNRSELAPLGKSKMEEMCTHSFSPGMTIILDNYTDKWKYWRSYYI